MKCAVLLSSIVIGLMTGIATAGPPANDECTGAIPIVWDSSIIADNTDATSVPDDPIFLCQNHFQPDAGAGSLWYTFVAAETEAIISTCGSDESLNSELHLFEGSCGNLVVIGCSSNTTLCGRMAAIEAEGLTIGQEYYVELAGRYDTYLGAYTLSLGPETTGACCTGASACIDDLTDDDCYDAGGLWLGTDSVCVDALSSGFCVAPPTCPPGAIIDNDSQICDQIAPDPDNSGCAGIFVPFQLLNPPDGCGTVVCGTNSADDRNNNNRDTDWFRIEPSQTAQYTACVTAQYFGQVQFWTLDSGIDPCRGTMPVATAVASPGTTACTTICIGQDQFYSVRVAPVDQDGEPQRSGIACLPYVLEITCETCTTGACCLPDTSCQVDIAEVDCIAAGGDYLGDESDCANAVCVGSCCEADGTCTEDISRDDCDARGGEFNGLGSMCIGLMCRGCSYEDPTNLDGLRGPFEDCSILAFDLINSGCTNGAPGNLFSPISCGDRMCGQTDHSGYSRDLDWYHLQLEQESEVLIELSNRLEPASPMLFRLQFRETQVGLPACGPGFNIIPEEDGNALPPGTTFFSANLPPARYTLLATFDFDTSNSFVGCLTPPEYNYQILVDCNPGCVATICGDSNCDGVVSVSDIGFFVTAVVSGSANWAGQFPSGFAPCDFVCANDTSGDGIVSVADIGLFVAAVLSGVCP